MAIVEYVIPLGEDVRKRHYHQAVKGKVNYFVVQIEVLLHKKWEVVIRYDCAHGFAHIDYYKKQGKKIKEKIELPLSEALIMADEDIKENWKQYVNEFLNQ